MTLRLDSPESSVVFNVGLGLHRGITVQESLTIEDFFSNNHPAVNPNRTSPADLGVGVKERNAAFAILDTTAMPCFYCLEV